MGVKSFTIAGIDFEELWKESPQQVSGVDNQRTTRRYLINWGQVQAAEIALLGSSYLQTIVDSGVTRRYIAREVPHADPDRCWLYATNITAVEGVKPIGKQFYYQVGARDDLSPGLGLTTVDQPPYPFGYYAAKYEKAKLTVVYEALPYDVVVDSYVVNAVLRVPDDFTNIFGLKRYIVVDDVPSSKFLLLRGSGYRWMPPPPGPPGPTVPPTLWRGNVVTSRNIPLPMPTSELTYTWFFVPEKAINFGYIRSRLGCTNLTTFDPEYQFPPRTLVLLSVQYPRKRLPGGGRGRNVVFRMRYQPAGVNSFPNPQNGNRMQEISTLGLPIENDALPVQPYSTAEFANFFRPAPLSV